MPAFGDVRQWRAAPLESAEAALKSDVDRLVRAGEQLEAAPDGWRGTAADAATAERTTLVTAVSETIAEVAAVRRAVADAADGVAALERDVTAVLEHARREEFTVTDAGVVVDVAEPPELTEDEAEAYTARRRATRDAIVGDVEAVLRLAGAIDADLTAVLGRATTNAVDHLGDPFVSALLGAAQGAVTWPAPPPGGSPGENAEWWRALSASQQQQILDDAPELVGNLDGIPGAVRDEANRARLPQLRAELEAEADRLRAQLDTVARNSAGAPGALSYVLGELEEVEAKLASLDGVEQLLDQPGDRQLLTLDTTGNRATAAVAVGDVDTAEHVAVFTPGMTSTVDGSLAGYDSDLVALRTQALAELDRAGSHEEDVAVVTWIGYEAPQWDETLGRNSVIAEGAAQRGAEKLASFLQGLTTVRDGDVHLTALAHSYGTTTTGLALHEETGVDDFVAFGSPGIGTTDADDLQVGGTIYHAEAKNDAVDDLGRFGVDLSYLDGVEQLSTSEEEHPAGRTLTEVEGHSDYLVTDSTSQYNIAVIVAGMPEKVITGDEKGLGDILSFPIVPFGG